MDLLVLLYSLPKNITRILKMGHKYNNTRNLTIYIYGIIFATVCQVPRYPSTPLKYTYKIRLKIKKTPTILVGVLFHKFMEL